MSRYNTDNPIGSADPRDRDDNSKNLDEAVNTTEDRWTDRFGNERVSLAGAVDPTGFAQSALDDANRAEAAADAAFVNADVYDDVVAGIDGTDDGEQFQVVEGDELVRYLNDDGAAVEVARYPAAGPTLALIRALPFLPDSVTETIWGVSDEIGNLAIQLLADGKLRAVLESLNMPGLQIEESSKLPASAIMAVVDATGNVGWMLTPTGPVPGGLDIDTPTTDLYHEVDFAFAEPWGDPSEELVLTWCSDSDEADVMEYRLEGSTTWHAAKSFRNRPFPARDGAYLYTAKMTALSPDAVYEYRVLGSTHHDKVKTPPNRGTIKIAMMNDLQTGNFGSGTNMAIFGPIVTELDPDLIFIPGDIVSDDGNVNSGTSERWRNFLWRLPRLYRTADGAQVPQFALIGNHEGRNPETGSSANDIGSAGEVGQIEDLFSWSYDDLHPSRLVNSAAYLKVGKELLLVGLETSHTEDLPPQIPWLSDVLANHADGVRHVVVSGHAPGFNISSPGRFTLNKTARPIRNEIWPIMTQYSEKIRCYACGHDHTMSVTEKLMVDYDPELSLSDNDTRWLVDNENGVRQIGTGPWGTAYREISSELAGLQSSIDGSNYIKAALGRDSNTIGDVTNVQDDAAHIWLLTFSEGAFNAKSYSKAGEVFYEVEESI